MLNDTDRQTDKSRAPILLEVGARRPPVQEAKCGLENRSASQHEGVQAAV
jgi:hypothetical protein